jgi:hypothetical protein
MGIELTDNQKAYVELIAPRRDEAASGTSKGREVVPSPSLAPFALDVMQTVSCVLGQQSFHYLVTCLQGFRQFLG